MNKEGLNKTQEIDDKENLNEDFCVATHLNVTKHCATSFISALGLEPKDGRGLEAMTMTVSHAHVTHGTSGRKGEKMSSVTVS